MEAKDYCTFDHKEDYWLVGKGKVARWVETMAMCKEELKLEVDGNEIR